MSRIQYIPIYIFVLVCSAGNACINEYRATVTGKILFSERGLDVPFPKFDYDAEYIKTRLRVADSIYKAAPITENYSDLGVMYAYAGNYRKAKQIFIDVEHVSPGRYNTAANLATVYELLGKNDSALHWIRTALKLNPRSHNGSEWIHEKILEAKIRSYASGDPLLCNTNILSLNFGDAEIPVNNSGVELEKVREQLKYQLSERMTFVKPKDPVVAQLLFQLGNVSALTTDVKSAIAIYEKAKLYGYTSRTMEERIDYFNSLQRKADFRNSGDEIVSNHKILLLTALSLAFVSFVTICIYYIRRCIFKNPGKCAGHKS